MNTNSSFTAIEELAKTAKVASYKLSASSLEERNNILQKLMDLLIKRRSNIEKANQEDIKNAEEEIKKGNYSTTLVKR